MHRVLSGLLGAGLLVNGSFMLIAPGDWYFLVPGVADSGPLNAHFARDVGAIYLLGALAFLGLGFSPSGWARGAAMLAAGFLALHALLHLGETIAGHHHAHFLRDLPGIYAPAALALWLALARPSPKLGKVTHETLADPPLHRGL